MKPVDPKKDRNIGLLIVAVAFFAALCISWWAREASTPNVSTEPGPPTTEGIVGHPSGVDVVATLEGARRLTAREELIGIAAEGVRRDGTVDLSAPGTRVRYAFQSERGKGPQPPRKPGTLPVRSYCGRQNVHVKREGLSVDPDQPTALCSAKPKSLPDPRCGPKEVWRHALERGAPEDQLARVEYYRARAGPAWRFEIPGTAYRFSVYGDCGKELTHVEAAGSVP